MVLKFAKLTGIVRGGMNRMKRWDEQDDSAL
jgi:hypothetical protein